MRESLVARSVDEHGDSTSSMVALTSNGNTSAIRDTYLEQPDRILDAFVVLHTPRYREDMQAVPVSGVLMKCAKVPGREGGGDRLWTPELI